MMNVFSRHKIFYFFNTLIFKLIVDNHVMEHGIKLLENANNRERLYMIKLKNRLLNHVEL